MSVDVKIQKGVLSKYSY